MTFLIDLVTDKGAVEFLRLDVEIIFLFDKGNFDDVFRFEVRFCLFDSFLFDEMILE